MAPETLDSDLYEGLRVVLHFLNPLTFVVWTQIKPVSLRMVSVDPFYTFLCPTTPQSMPQIDLPEKLILVNIC